MDFNIINGPEWPGLLNLRNAIYNHLYYDSTKKNLMGTG